MKVIWKCTLDPVKGGRIEMPAGAKPLHVHEQSGEVRIWAECDTDAATVTRLFGVIPTGNEVPNGSYLGSVHIDDPAEHGSLSYVFHIYDYGEPVVREPLTVDLLREACEEISGLLETTTPDEIVSYWSQGNPAAAMELLERAYHVQSTAGNTAKAMKIHTLITTIGEDWTARR